ncbi:MAG TPA: secondary thiamine-phosphate synthase enzyme YjbQ [Anaerolineaceae bacterium]
MIWHKDTLIIQTRGKGLYPFTDQVNERIRRWSIHEGLCCLYLQHTSASLAIGENYDATAQQDMESFLEKLVPDHQSWYTHTAEGADDASSHLRALILPTSETIPVENGKLTLGTWQGIYLFEHRSLPHRRKILLRCLQISD